MSTEVQQAQLAEIRKRDAETGHSRPWTADAHDRRALLGILDAIKSERNDLNETLISIANKLGIEESYLLQDPDGKASDTIVEYVRRLTQQLADAHALIARMSPAALFALKDGAPLPAGQGWFEADHPGQRVHVHAVFSPEAAKELVEREAQLTAFRSELASSRQANVELSNRIQERTHERDAARQEAERAKQQLAALSAPGGCRPSREELGKEQFRIYSEYRKSKKHGLRISWSGLLNEVQEIYMITAEALYSKGYADATSQHRQQVAELEGRLRDAEEKNDRQEQLIDNFQAASMLGIDPDDIEPDDIEPDDIEREITELRQKLTVTREELETANERAESASKSLQLVCDKPIGDITFYMVAGKSYRQHVKDWLTSNVKVGKESDLYHGVLPLGMVGTWIDRATRAERELITLRAELAQLRQRAEGADELQRKLDRAYTRIGELDWELGQKTIGSNPAERLAKAERKAKRLRRKLRWSQSIAKRLLNDDSDEQEIDRLAAELAATKAQADQISAECGEARNQLAARDAELTTAKSRLDALSTDLATSESRCGARERELERVRRACEPFAAYYGAVLKDKNWGKEPNVNAFACVGGNQITYGNMRELLAAFSPPAPATQPDSPPAFRCPKCGSEWLTHFIQDAKSRTHCNACGANNWSECFKPAEVAAAKGGANTGESK